MNFSHKYLTWGIAIVWGSLFSFSTKGQTNDWLPEQAYWMPGAFPDRIIVNLTETPMQSVAVNWRTAAAFPSGKVQWATASHGAGFLEERKEIRSNSEFLSVRHETNPTVEAYYHSAVINELVPGETYVYRVGSGDYWTEWMQFTMADPENDGISFLYLGDAQNGVRDHWSRLLRKAYAEHPDVDFVVHAGDLINRHNNDLEWGEWFSAGNFIHATVPSIMTPGNHEYGKDEELSPQWRPQFNLPLNGPAGLEETCYQVNYPQLKLISLNAEEIEESPHLKQKQVEWLDSLLRNDPREWTVITIHHPFYSTKENRDNEDLRKHFKPLMDKYQVDLVLQGHDHSYGRGMIGPDQNGNMKEVVAEETGTVYVVSMAGLKMYAAEDYPWMHRKASNTQMYQFIEIQDNKLVYKAFTVTGELYDAFELHKDVEGSNTLLNSIPDIPEY
ncbi:MAG: metallophosphoesterase family protein [Cyclobacterium sp.]|uniref:purple acid phosphatase family protein n=1 Tax=unclassified Cyclobacterium TaxID=2615055 RepID=UPI0013D6CD2B|nr:metallophosphoesterase family protein [Cyclobacterium sp. SYSU L10401]